MTLKSNAVPETGDEVNDEDEDDDDKTDYKRQINKRKTTKGRVTMCLLCNTYAKEKSISCNNFSKGIRTNWYIFLRSSLTQQMSKTKTKRRQTKKKSNNTGKTKISPRRSQRIKEGVLKQEIQGELKGLNQEKREHLLQIITQDDVINWEKYADLAGLFIPQYEDYSDTQSETTADSSARWKDPTPPRYTRDMMEQKLATTEELFHDTIKIIIKPALKYIEELYYRQNKAIDKEGQETLYKILTGDDITGI